jgi:threonine dehydrogenase-like Zn-dependent dehydrogenase
MIELQRIDLPPCGPDEVVAETLFSFVSPGTELRVLSGIGESKSRFPLIPGYSWVGRIIEVGRNLKGWAPGDLVSGRNTLPIPGLELIWGGQAAYHRCEVKGYCAVLKLPAGADPWDYVMAEVAAISWRGVTSAFPAPNETAIVIGQGLIGAFNARWLLLHGARVIVVDLEESRLDRARKWGVCAALNGRDPDLRERILAHCEDGADIVIESSASVVGAKLAPTLLRQPAARRMNTAYAVPELHSNAHAWPRLVYQASYTQTIETGPSGPGGPEGVLVLRPGDRTVQDRLAVIEHIRAGRLNVADILGSPTPVTEAPQAYLELRDHPDRRVAVAFDWAKR